MPSTTNSSKTAEQLERKNRWNSKRERERNQARYRIQQRLVRQVECGPEETSKNPSSRCPSSVDIVEEDDIAILAMYVEAVESGSVSTFSLRNLEKHRYILSRRIPIHHLHKRRYSEISMSRFGEQRRDEVTRYLRPMDEGVGSISMLEYCALLGEYDCLKNLIVGAFDLVASDLMATNLDRYNRIVQKVSRRLLLDKNVPLTLSAYLVKAVAEMRMQGWNWCRAERTEHEICCLCYHDQRSLPLLCFGGGCRHTFCELCLWEDMIGKFDERASGDVVLCPVCSDPYMQNDCTASASDSAEVLPSDRRRLSLERYNALPVDTKALRSLAREKKITRRKTKKNTIHNNWLDATMLKLGSSQEVRRDRCYRFVIAGDVHSVRCVLEAGVDVNMTNEYNQTPLYLACWRGHVDIIRLLLSWGADPSVHANGGMSCYNALQANGVDDLDLLSLFDAKWQNEVSKSLLLKDRLLLGAIGSERPENSPDPALTILMNFDSVNDCPGGAFYVDNVLPKAVLSKIDELFHSLPVDVSDKAIKQKKAKPCSKRSYFCDAEGALREALEGAMVSVLRGAAIGPCPCNAIVFAQMRFLNYDEPSGWLAPHTDLSRTDPALSQRSTHTFILYLTDAASHGLIGGETALLASHTPGDTLAKVVPKRGRLFLFPHTCLHEGCEVISPPKIILRGEALLGFK